MKGELHISPNSTDLEGEALASSRFCVDVGPGNSCLLVDPASELEPGLPSWMTDKLWRPGLKRQLLHSLRGDLGQGQSPPWSNSTSPSVKIA